MNNTSGRRLTGREIGLLRVLHASDFAVSLNRFQRTIAVPMWRGGLVNAWYRQVPELSPSFQGPYFSLSHSGLRLASHFTRPRASAATTWRG